MSSFCKALRSGVSRHLRALAVATFFLSLAGCASFQTKRLKAQAEAVEDMHKLAYAENVLHVLFLPPEQRSRLLRVHAEAKGPHWDPAKLERLLFRIDHGPLALSYFIGSEDIEPYALTWKRGNLHFDTPLSRGFVQSSLLLRIDDRVGEYSSLKVGQAFVSLGDYGFKVDLQKRSVEYIGSFVIRELFPANLVSTKP